MVPVALTTMGRLGAADLETEVDPGYGVVRSIPWGPVLSGPITVDDGAGNQLPIYPYSGFARDGDALGIPFIGAYRIYRDVNNDGLVDAGDELVELVPATLDAYFADSPDALIAPATTHVGRFIPQGSEDTVIANGMLDPGEDLNGNGVLDRFVPTGAVADNGFYWAEDLFEYITTLHAPGKDLEPHADHRYVDNTATNDDNRLIANPTAVPAQNAFPTTLFGQAPDIRDNDGDGYGNGLVYDAGTNTWNAPTTALDIIESYREAFRPVEGLINLNTADFGILKTLPLAVDGNGNVLPWDSANPDSQRISGANPGNPLDGLAGMVYLGRDSGLGFRPYESIFRLNGHGSELPLEESFRQYDVDNNPATPLVVTRKAAGDWTGVRPHEPLTPLIRPTFADLLEDEDLNGNGIQDGTEADTNGDGFGSWYYDQPEASVTPIANYEDDTIQITRISNLTTTRSDSYTVYIVVQAWENFGRAPGSTNPGPARMIRQQRSSFIVDRSGILPFNPLTGQPWSAADVNGDAWRQALKITPVPVK
jgi:hypothetical protein